MPIGPSTLVRIALPEGIDGNIVLQFQRRDNLTAEDVVSEAAAAAADLNQELLENSSSLLTMTEEPDIMYAGDTPRRETPVKGEFKRSDGQRSEESGHMLPIRDYEDANEWTQEFLRLARRQQLDNDMRTIGLNWRDRYWKGLWGRALLTTEQAIGSGFNPGWAIGTGTNLDFIPPGWNAFSFDSTHTHYLFVDSASGDWGDLLKAQQADLNHHGHTGRLVCFTSLADVDTIAAVAGFVRMNPAGFGVIQGPSTDDVRIFEAEVQGVPGELYGFFQTNKGIIELRWDGYIPQNYSYMTKSYGQDNPQNGLVLRVWPGRGFGLIPDPQVTKSINPELDFVLFKGAHGWGVNDRTNGVAGYIANGASAYVNPATLSL